jgi:hypothetical protein
VFPGTYFPSRYYAGSFFADEGSDTPDPEDPEGDGMATSFRGNVTMSVLGQYANVQDLGQSNFDVAQNWPTSYTPGTGNGQADRIFADNRTLLASAAEDLDLAGGGLIDPVGGALTFVKITDMLFRASDANTNNVVIGPASSNGFLGPFGAATHTIAIPPGGQVRLSAPKGGWVVTPSTADLLHIANSSSGTPVSFDIILIGRSA